MTLPKALFRTDASSSSGLGHLMRCQALAGEWIAQGGKATFVTSVTADALLDGLREEGLSVRARPAGSGEQEKLAWFIPILKDEKPSVLVLDGYEFDLDYQREVRPWIQVLVCLDDRPERRFACDIVLNQNLGVTAGDYAASIGPDTKLLLGTRYALLRPEFKQAASSYRVSPQPCRVLVTLGGADEADHTAWVLGELAVLADIQIDVVLGPLYTHSDPRKRVIGLKPDQVRIHRGFHSMLDLARHADLAVTAGGSTVWELACLGMPMVVLGTAGNQDAVLRGLREESAAAVLGPAGTVAPGSLAETVRSLLADRTRLQKLSEAASRLVDGRGASRVVEQVHDLCAESLSRVGARANRGNP